ncbi:MAG: GTPase HflX [Candidatus Rokubacteria bacterium GWC2_70_24]|nr:MAG: GTPase HflX [Candidatus Rokubacteria bacterium GWA2_70_23]OGK88849.1 MAG: GTPase HflX [Candidatus Rokubacteria bacterium GWC2_70_24]OGK88930.1 MAG: GTPase HflX [Candidatus Rokubacteria bacterium GWF2_70_14]
MTGREKAVLGAVRLPTQRRFDVEESLDELERLAESAGAEVVGRVTQDRKAPTPALYFGKGKVEDLRAWSRQHGADLMISDDPLSPVQERNLGGSLGLKVIDRTALILDLFAQRARSMEGKLQVELAQLSYLLPRLVRQWKHLERLGGGIGTRGPGETQLESDRRIIRHRIEKIRGELRRVRSHRRLVRERRKATGFSVVALVGYTNSGKTTLLNRLTGAGRPAADQLFVTLDPTARLVAGGEHSPFILTDTVGFIRKLPHQLVEAFKATLEELEQADLLVHVLDASHPGLEEQAAAVESLLAELGLVGRPTVVALNKIDKLEGGAPPRMLVKRFDGVPISAHTGAGMDRLLDRIDSALRGRVERAVLRIPYRDGLALSLCYDRGRVLARSDEPDGIRLEVELPPRLLGPLEPYRDAG